MDKPKLSMKTMLLTYLLFFLIGIGFFLIMIQLLHPLWFGVSLYLAYIISTITLCTKYFNLKLKYKKLESEK